MDSREEKALEELTERYKKLIEPGKVAKAGKKAKKAISQKIPNSVKALADNTKQAVAEAEIYEKVMKIGPCLKIDLGIVKCHFELGAEKENFKLG